MLLPDFPAFVPGHTPLDHVAMTLDLYGRLGVDDERVMAVLRELDLIPLHRTPLGEASRGQAYKTALAALVLADPELWLLDEPFASGMDPQGMLVLKERARAAAAAGTTIVYTTQILEIAERFADRLVVLDHGRVAMALERSDLAAMPPDGPGSLGERLRAYREQGPGAP
jgi:ABC-type multidrug transport system ATPase subunit